MSRFLLASWTGVSLASLILAACGGGGGAGNPSGSASSGAAPAQLLGSVQGLGSVVVNGVRMSTLGSTISDEDGHVFQQGKVGLGQVVLVTGNVNSDGLTGTASQLSLLREFAGPIQAVSANGFTLLGQNFSVNASTVFTNESSSVPQSLAQIQAGDYVEVYAVRQSEGNYLATRVEEQSGLSSLESGVEGRGLVSNLDTTARSFSIGNLTVSYDNATVQGSLANGVAVRFKSSQNPVYAVNGNARITANSVQVKGIQNRLSQGAGQIELTGYVESDAGDQNPSTFSLAGVTVDVSNARFEGLASMAIGQLVEVKGVLTNNILVASKVETEEARQSSRGGKYEFYGTTSNGTYASASNTLSFSVQGQNVVFTRPVAQGTTDVCGISSAGATPYVEVKGLLSNGIVQASKLECKSTTVSGGNDRDFSGNRFEMEGIVMAYDNAAATFVLNNTRVSFLNTRFKNGNASRLRNGVRVEVKGALDANQVFQATELEFED